MKKIMAICLTLIMVMSLGVAAFAAPGRFVSSPSVNKAPVLISYENESSDCTAKLILTAYADRKTLPVNLCTMIEKAYDMIVGTDDLSTLNSGVADLAKDAGVKVTALSVSDLFDLRYVGCKKHNPHGSFRIVIEPETLRNFVCLLHFYNGEWSIVDSAKVINDGKYLEFTAKEFSPFAIVVKTDAENVTPPHTGDNSSVIICAFIMAVSVMAIVVVSVTSKRKSRKAKEV